MKFAPLNLIWIFLFALVGLSSAFSEEPNREPAAAKDSISPEVQTWIQSKKVKPRNISSSPVGQHKTCDQCGAQAVNASKDFESSAESKGESKSGAKTAR
jgi:hypothetical protein